MDPSHETFPSSFGGKVSFAGLFKICIRLNAARGADGDAPKDNRLVASLAIVWSELLDAELPAIEWCEQLERSIEYSVDSELSDRCFC